MTKEFLGENVLEGDYLEQVEWMARVWTPRQLAEAVRRLSPRAALSPHVTPINLPPELKQAIWAAAQAGMDAAK